MEPSGGGFRRRFPPPIFSSGSLLSLCFWFCVSPPPSSGKRRGTIFIVVFRSRGSFGKKDQRKWSHEAQKGGPTRPGTGATWGTLFWPSGLRLLASFAPRSSCFQKNDPRKCAAHYDVVKALKQIRKEIGVFCLHRINSIKKGKHY